MSRPEAINWEMCIQKAMDKEDLAVEMLDKIIETFPEALSDMESALNDSQYDSLEAAVHKLNGVCLYSGLPEIHETGKTLESALRAGQHDQVHQLFTAFKHAITEVMNTYQTESYK